MGVFASKLNVGSSLFEVQISIHSTRAEGAELGSPVQRAGGIIESAEKLCVLKERYSSGNPIIVRSKFIIKTGRELWKLCSV